MVDRGVSPVVGMVFLVGLTTIVGVSVIVVGITVIDGAQSTAERNQAENSMVELADTADEVATSRAKSQEFVVSEDDGTTWIDESAGEMELVVINGSVRTPIQIGDLGVYRYETADGTEIAYQGGGVWRYDQGQPQMVEPPSISHRERGNASTLDLRVTRISEGTTNASATNGDVSVVDSKSLLEGSGLSNPVRGDRIELRIQSRYCEGWQAFVNETAEYAIREACSSGATDEVVLETSIPDPINSSSPDPRPGGQWWGDDAVRTTSDFDVEPGTAGEIDGNVSAGDSISTPWSFDIANENYISPGPETYDTEIANRKRNTSWGPLCETGTSPSDPSDNDCSYSAGTHYIDDDNLNNLDIDVVLDVTAGNVTMVLDTDLMLRNNQSIKLRGYSSTDNVAKIYTADDVTFANHGFVGPPNAADFHDPGDNYTGHASSLRFYGGSNTELSLEDEINFEGIFDAPAGNNGTSKVVNSGGMNAKISGAIRTGEFDIENGGLYRHTFDDSLGSGGGNPPRTNKSSSTDSDEFYLHVKDTEIEIED